jgi:oligoribonuclease NrnB/cAMP/cGMP phosphodiesterase (DHH superfamily)
MSDSIICVHHTDLDGMSSAAIVRRAVHGVELRAMNYGDLIPDLSGRHVIMVDFSFQPFDAMVKLGQQAASLTWIDHHRSAIEAAKAAKFPAANCREGVGACYLTWNHFQGGRPPQAIELLSKFDVWDYDENRDTDVLPFQYGMLSLPHGPSEIIWDHVLQRDADLSGIIDRGRAVHAYLKQDQAEVAKATSFETEFEGHKAIAINGVRGSMAFAAVFDPKRHALMIAFRWSKGGWTVSLYTERNDIDCGALCKKHGGGGHPGAAGFQCKKLPFELR